MKTFFLEAVDVLYLRGNKLFGAAGDDALAQMPPWPSVAAGAIRSRMLVDAKVCLADFAKGNAKLSDTLHQSLGTPEKVGDFHVAHFGLAMKKDNKLTYLFPLPADCVVLEDEVLYAEPQPLAQGIMAEPATPQVPLLRMPKQQKVQRGYWLNQLGWIAYLHAKKLSIKKHLIAQDKLWKLDPRLGIALDQHTRTAQDGKIYTTDAVALAQGVGFVAVIAGADAVLPQDGLLRFGGDGRAVALHTEKGEWPYPDWKKIEKHGRFKLVLRSPAILPDGWTLPNIKEGRWHCGKGSARLVSAVVARPEIISGWDIAKHRPKTAQKVVPTGSVYWLDDWQGDIAELKKMVQEGLACVEPARRAEGFNHCMIAAWPNGGEKDASCKT